MALIMQSDFLKRLPPGPAEHFPGLPFLQAGKPSFTGRGWRAGMQDGQESVGKPRPPPFCEERTSRQPTGGGGKAKGQARWDVFGSPRKVTCPSCQENKQPGHQSGSGEGGLIMLVCLQRESESRLLIYHRNVSQAPQGRLAAISPRLRSP